MLKVDYSLNHIPARREHVIALFESINQPLVNIPNHGTAPTGAFILGTRNDHGYFTVFVYLYQPETKAVMIYVSEPRNLTPDQYRVEELEAIRFVESMGFMVDNVHFPTLGVPEQEAVMARVPLFRPLERTVDLYEAVETGNVPAVQQQPHIQQSQTGHQVDAMFGGMNPQAGQVFQQVGLSNPGTSQTGSHQPIQKNTPASSPYAQGLTSGLVAASDPSQTGAPPVPGSGPAQTPQSGGDRPQLSAESLERLGRLFGAFCFLLVAFLAMSACKSGGAQRNSKGAAAHADMGNQHLSQGKWVEAVKSFSVALEQDEAHRDALRGLGVAYLKLGKLAEAERFSRRAVEVDPKWSEPKNELATTLIQLEQCEEAEQLLREVLKDIFYKTPWFAEHNLARALRCQNKAEEALDLLEKTVTKQPHFCLGYLTLSEISAQLKKHETTIEACDSFRKNCAEHEKIKEQVLPEYSDMCYLRSGLAHAAIGDVESARASFKRCQSGGALGKECRRTLEMLPR